MPELPEVETTLRAVRPVLIGRRIEGIEILRPNMVRHDRGFASRIKGKKVEDVRRHGKYLFVHLEGELTMLLHLKISGRLGLRKKKDIPLTFERIRFDLGGDTLLVFNDPRTLGRAWVTESAKVAIEKSVKRLGPDALTVSEAEFLKRLEKKKGILKSVLLDQSFVAGVGNIYADEACFLAKIDPRRKVATLSKAERKKLYASVIKTLEKGIRNMGTSFSDFADLFGKPGQNQKSLMVYGRKGEPCRSCKTTLKSCVIGQRTTVWCPKCQE